jgi:hypothetical protein
MTTKLTIASIAMAMMASTANAQQVEHTQSTLHDRRGWIVNEGLFPNNEHSNYCITQRSSDYQDFEISGYEYEGLEVVLWDSRWNLEARDLVNFSIEIDNNSKWSVEGPSYSGSISTWFVDQRETQQFLDEVSRGSRLRITTEGGKQLANVSLSGSSAAVSVFSDCWARIQAASEEAADPFASDINSDPFANDASAQTTIQVGPQSLFGVSIGTDAEIAVLKLQTVLGQGDDSGWIDGCEFNSVQERYLRWGGLTAAFVEQETSRYLFTNWTYSLNFETGETTPGGPSKTDILLPKGVRMGDSFSSTGGIYGFKPVVDDVFGVGIYSGEHFSMMTSDSNLDGPITEIAVPHFLFCD